MRFENFIGNPQARDALKTAIAGERVANAYLLSGPPGVGKRTLARIAAQALLCRNREGAEPCGRCDSCLRFAGEDADRITHPDYHLVEPEGRFIKVDQVRKRIVAAVQLRPYESKRSVFVIDPADAMNPSAANAFLKTLEEAPGSAVFFLISQKPVALLPTIRSRCQAVSLHPVGRPELAGILVSRLALSEEEALTIAACSGGAVGMALRFDRAAFLRDRDTALQFAGLCLGEGGLDEVFELASRLQNERDRFGELLELFFVVLRDIMLAASAGYGAPIINEDIRARITDMARGRSPRKLALLISALADMRDPLIRNVRVDSISERLMLQGQAMFSRAGEGGS